MNLLTKHYLSWPRLAGQLAKASVCPPQLLKGTERVPVVIAIVPFAPSALVTPPAHVQRRPSSLSRPAPPASLLTIPRPMRRCQVGVTLRVRGEESDAGVSVVLTAAAPGGGVAVCVLLLLLLLLLSNPNPCQVLYKPIAELIDQLNR